MKKLFRKMIDRLFPAKKAVLVETNSANVPELERVILEVINREMRPGGILS